jgi:NAD(P)H dehydrogenase (quinone)
MHAPPKAEHIVVDPTTLDQYDGIIFGTPTRFGMMSAQMKGLFDATGGLWQSGALRGKTGGVFVSTGTQGGGQETTPLTAVTQLTHHGMLYVPFGYGHPTLQFDNSATHGGTPYGPGTLAGADGSAQPLEGEMAMCQAYGEYFAGITHALKVGRQ